MRVKTHVPRQRKKKRLRKAVRGSFGGRSKLLRVAKENLVRSMRNAYIGRKRRKRDFRRLWIERINAAARQRGLVYSVFINGLSSSGVEVDRKMLAEIAVHDPAAFDRLVEVAREGLELASA